MERHWGVDSLLQIVDDLTYVLWLMADTNDKEKLEAIKIRIDELRKSLNMEDKVGRG